MNMHSQVYSLCIFFLGFCCVVISFLARPSICGIESFVYGGCSQLKYNPGTTYESNVNSVLTSLVNSAAYSSFNNFKVSLPGSTQCDVVYGLFQCRGDLSNSDCHYCVGQAVSQLGIICVATVGGALQLDGCLVKYDNTSFLGVEDKAVAMHKCGPSIWSDSDTLTRRYALLEYLTDQQGQYFRAGGSGNVQGVAQCTQDLSVSECQDCLSEAIGRLKSECPASPSGDVFLVKCYARYWERGYASRSEKHHDDDHDDDHDDHDDDHEKTLAITIGLTAGVALLVVFVCVLYRVRDKRECK